MRKPDIDRLYAGKFTAFADCLIVGILVLLASLPVVTAFVAVTAGTALLRDRAMDDTTVGLGPFGTRLLSVTRSGWQGFVVPTAAIGVFAADYLALRAGLRNNLPVTVAIGLVVTVCCVFFLRAAAGWRPGQSWLATAITAARRTVQERSGSTILGAVMLTAVLLAAWIPAVSVVVLGPMCLAAAAIESGGSRLGMSAA